MLRLKDAWENLGQTERASAVDLDVKRATLLAEELEEEAREGKVTEKELAEWTGISQQRIAQLLRYQRFLHCCQVNTTTVVSEITEGRFRQYWQQMSDPQTMRSFRCNPRHEVTYAKKQAEQAAYERRVFVAILEWLEAGKEPLKRPKRQAPPTVEEMFKKKNPVTALRKEVNRRFTDEFKPMAATLREYLGRDRASYTPNLMANAAIALTKWERAFEELLKQFDTYVKD
jgi:hypothetical protein